MGNDAKKEEPPKTLRELYRMARMLVPGGFLTVGVEIEDHGHGRKEGCDSDPIDFEIKLYHDGYGHFTGQTLVDVFRRFKDDVNKELKMVPLREVPDVIV